MTIREQWYISQGNGDIRTHKKLKLFGFINSAVKCSKHWLEDILQKWQRLGSFRRLGRNRLRVSPWCSSRGLGESYWNQWCPTRRKRQQKEKPEAKRRASGTRVWCPTLGVLFTYSWSNLKCKAKKMYTIPAWMLIYFTFYSAVKMFTIRKDKLIAWSFNWCWVNSR